MHRTPKHVAADYLLGESLIDWIDARRPATSWRRLSLELRDATKGEIEVTPESLRAWYNAARPAKPIGNTA